MNEKNKAAVELGRLGGKSKTAKKSNASRNNGRLGGRPRKNKRTIQKKVLEIRQKN